MATVVDNQAKLDGDDVTARSPRRGDGGRAISETVLKELVRLFKLLADETRMRILFLLAQRGEVNVRSLCDTLGQSQPAVSHHLALMRADGLIDCRRQGKHNFYRLLPDRFDPLRRAISPDGAPGSYDQFRRQLLNCLQD